jgi:CO/xanthine dehydrogenase Mo-binding subunit
MRNTTPTRIVGTSVLRKEGFGKVTGGAHYIDDITLPGMWHGATVRSNIARGNIKKIRFGGGIAWDEFVIVTAKDIPGDNCIPLIVDHDQPVLADKRVNHPEEPIVLLAHPDKARLHEAVAAVEIDYDPLPAVFTIEESERQQPIVWGEDNCIKRYLVEKAMWIPRGEARRTLSPANTAPALRSSSTLKTTASLRSGPRPTESLFRDRCSARTMCTKRCCAFLICPRKKFA